MLPLSWKGRVWAETASPTLWKMKAEEDCVVAEVSVVLSGRELAMPLVPEMTILTSTSLRQT